MFRFFSACWRHFVGDDHHTAATGLHAQRSKEKKKERSETDTNQQGEQPTRKRYRDQQLQSHKAYREHTGEREEHTCAVMIALRVASLDV